MTKQTGTIITVVVAIVVLVCCTAPLCSAGVALFAGAGSELDPDLMVPPASGLVPCCFSILVLVAPLLCWLFLVRGKENGAVEEYVEGSFEEEFTE
jgi:hypothetical protein